MTDAAFLPDLQSAREFARLGRTEEAERAYARLLDSEPDEPEALNYVALCEMRRGNRARTLELLERALRRHPGDFTTLMNVGSARESAGDFEGARAAFAEAVRVHPDQAVAKLNLGHALERGGRGGDALLAYFGAIAAEQKAGRWHDRATTTPALLERVTHAMRYVRAGRRELFDGVLEPLVRGHGSDALARVRECLTGYLGDSRAVSEDARQRPSFLYFPGLPATPWFAREQLPWIGVLEAQTAAIREELLAVLPRSGNRERVFASDAEEHASLACSQGAPTWEGLYFWRHSELRAESHRECPATSAALAAIPLVHIREHAPEVMFSVLTPGTHILPHRGVTNTRAVCHLPLIVPPDCALVVGGDTHIWREGEVVVFDDTFEHEAWNRGTSTRVVLIADIWNPHLTPPEREALTILIEAIGDFAKAAGT